MPEAGRLILVVGPSGSGKDTLIAALRDRLSGNPAICFPQRLITRPAADDAECHHPVTECEFEALVRSGVAALHWRAHGNGYAVPGSILDDLSAGRDVVVNVSRTVVAEAQHRFPNVLVLAIDARPEVLATRLAARGRETPDAVAKRLARAGQFLPDSPDAVRIDNSDELSAAVYAMLRAIGRDAAKSESPQ